jgi:hypothetical protein
LVIVNTCRQGRIGDRSLVPLINQPIKAPAPRHRALNQD